MTKQYVDRGEPLKGINRTLRDARAPYDLARAMENFSLPDGRLRRRTGFEDPVAGRDLGNWLAKQTGTAIVSRAGKPAANQKSSVFKTPLSYAVLKYDSAYDITLGSSWTREFHLRLGDKEPLVVTPFKRIARKPTGSVTFDTQVRTEGVFVFDQTILSNSHRFDNGTISSPDYSVGSPLLLNYDHSAGDKHYHAFPLTTMAISYTEAAIQLEMGVVEKTAGGYHGIAGTYWPREINLSYSIPGGAYTVGATYHVAVRYNDSTTTLELVVDGSVADSYVFGAPGNADVTNYALIGEYDDINEITYASGYKRDIVLLNECTVRGSYSSACKIQTFMNGHQTFYHSYVSSLGDPDDPAMPWCCSPPRGTAIRALRFWNGLRDDTALSTYDTSDEVEDSPTGLIGHWNLTDGSGVCEDKTAAAQTNQITIHHGHPTYIGNTELLHDLGLRVAEGQHFKFSTSELSQKYLEDVSTQLISCFGYDAKETIPDNPDPASGANPGYDDVDRIKSQHDFSVQIQFRTPSRWQPEINDASTAGGDYGTLSLEDDYTHLKNLGTAREERNSLQGSQVFNQDMRRAAIVDGGSPSEDQIYFRDSRQIAGQASGTQWVEATNYIFNRAYDTTLFSIEGAAEDDENETNNYGNRARVPLTRGLVTPDGYLAFECYLAGDTDTYSLAGWTTPYTQGKGRAHPTLHRVIGETVLQNDRTYTATFVKRATYNFNNGFSVDTPNGFVLEIWLQDITGNTAAAQEWAATPYKREIIHYNCTGVRVPAGAAPEYWQITTVGNHGLVTGTTLACQLRGTVMSGAPSVNHNITWDGEATDATTGIRLNFSVGSGTMNNGTNASRTLIVDSSLRSSFCRHKAIYDIIVGASQINSGFDRSVTLPNTTGESIYGPWMVPQHFMTPYQDQPGDFTIGFFRLWAGVAISEDEIKDFGNASISTKDYSPHLVVNAEIEENAGNQILNKARYPLILSTGYKSWGSPPSAPIAVLGGGSPTVAPFIKEDWVPGGWMLEDSLGYIGMFDAFGTYDTNRNSECKGLAPFQTTITQSYGLLAAFDDHLGIDSSLEGTLEPVYLTAHGMLNDFSTKGEWRGISIGDRTILVSDSGLPKVYNGKNGVVAGFKDWSGGLPMMSVISVAAGSLGFDVDDTADTYYGFRLVYVSEEYSITHISEASVIKVGAGVTANVEIYNVAPHYDPRVTAIYVYRTRAQSTRSLAENADLFPVFEGSYANIFHPKITIAYPDDRLFPAPLDRFQTSIPIARHGASVGGRLYLGGNRAVPDAIYYSVAGNPEKFDTLTQSLILEEGSGDIITGMVGLFGVLFVFKANSTWRVEEVGGGVIIG